MSDFSIIYQPFQHFSLVAIAGLAALSILGLIASLFAICWLRGQSSAMFKQCVCILLCSLPFAIIPPAFLGGVVLAFGLATFSSPSRGS
ncbi:MAG: hypothetical protein WBR17_40110 [Paraburkholderia sp.]|uniref:hypothetical protein n=1 Tax=Paraburkholderia sp. TaxID=1926495 RepID=UPI003C693AF6